MRRPPGMPGKGALMDVQREEYSHLPIVEGKIGQGVKFERIRRISGYLVGTTDRWNNAKRAELRDRVNHIKINGESHEQV